MVYLSPLLSKLSKRMPYSVPQGYFEGLEESLISSVQVSGQSAREELEKLSPLLSSLNKEMPYSVPQGYFENLAIKPVTEKNKAGMGAFHQRNPQGDDFESRTTLHGHPPHFCS